MNQAVMFSFFVLSSLAIPVSADAESGNGTSAGGIVKRPDQRDIRVVSNPVQPKPKIVISFSF